MLYSSDWSESAMPTASNPAPLTAPSRLPRMVALVKVSARRIRSWNSVKLRAMIAPACRMQVSQTM